MKCIILLHFILVFAVCQSTRLGVSSIQSVKEKLFLARRKTISLSHGLSEPEFYDASMYKLKKIVDKLLLTCCLLLLPLWESVIVLCFVVRNFMSLLVLQSSWWGRESWLPCLVCLPGVSWLLCGSSARCHGFVCCLWLWYFLINSLTIFGNSSFQRRLLEWFLILKRLAITL